MWDDRSFERITGLDVSWRSLEIARRRLSLDRLPPAQRKLIELLHGSLMYRDKRLSGFAAAAVIEVVEHLDPPRLAAFERVLFEQAEPRAIVITTPSVEYNRMSLPLGRFRHKDHRFGPAHAVVGKIAGVAPAAVRSGGRRGPRHAAPGGGRPGSRGWDQP